MNYEKIIYSIDMVLKAMNNLEVKGKANVTNLAGGIGLLEQIKDTLSHEAKRESLKVCDAEEEKE